MNQKEKLFVLVSGSFLLVVSAVLLVTQNSLSQYSAVSTSGLCALVAWFFSRQGLLGGRLDYQVIPPVAAALSGLAIFSIGGAGILEGLAILIANLAVAAIAGLTLRWLMKRGAKRVVSLVALLVSSVVIQILILFFVQTPDWSDDSMSFDDFEEAWNQFAKILFVPGQVVWLLQLVSLLGLMGLIRGRILARTSNRMATQELSPEIRVKRFFSARVLAAVTVSLFVSVWLFARAIGMNVIQVAFDSWLFDQSLYLMFFSGVAAVGGFFYVWIPSLIANRALQKGKSWGAFFWLSALVSPLIMWIIAEASSDTRNVYQQPVQPAPAPQSHPGYQSSVSTQVVAGAPAKDTRVCPECAEEIKMAAKLCKHCGSKVEPLA